MGHAETATIEDGAIGCSEDQRKDTPKKIRLC
jgi:hypothetical protein